MCPRPPHHGIEKYPSAKHSSRPAQTNMGIKTLNKLGETLRESKFQRGTEHCRVRNPMAMKQGGFVHQSLSVESKQNVPGSPSFSLLGRAQ